MRQYELIRNEEGGDAGGGAAVADPTEEYGSDPSTPPTFDASGMFDADGKFQEIGDRFKNDSVDADYINRNFKGKSPSDLAKMLKDNQTAARAKSVSYPGADATDEDWSRFREAAGVPESADQVMPEDFESFQNATGWTEEVATPVVDALIQSGAPGPAITAGLAAVQEAAAAQAEKWQAEAQERREAGKQQLLEAFGTETDARINGATVAAEKLGIQAGLSQEQIEGVKQVVSQIDSPELTRMFAHLSDAISEASYRGPGQTAKVDDFRGPAETAQAIMEDDQHPMHAKFMAGDDAVHKHVDTLLAKARDIA